MTERVAIIDYGSGNLRSVQKALQRASAEAGLGFDVALVAEADALVNADRVVLPGVGAFRECYQGLAAVPGMLEVLDDVVLKRGAPFFGICVGMQLLADRGLEFGETKGLGWISGDVTALPANAEFRSPHMGWNAVRFERAHPAVPSDLSGADFYFAHSYYFEVKKSHEMIGVCAYGQSVPAIIGRDNLLACQFHPEKSQDVGIALLDGFLRWRP